MPDAVHPHLPKELAVAILTPRGRDADVATALLTTNGISAFAVTSLKELATEMQAGIGAVMIAEEALADPYLPEMHTQIARQSAWSDLPFIVLTNGAKVKRTPVEAHRIDALGNALLLSRPLQGEDLLRAATSALRARRRQYEARERLSNLEDQGARLRASEAKFQAIVNSIDQMIWSTRPDGYHDYYNERWYEYTGVSAGSTDGEEWAGLFHPDDQDRTWTLWRHSLESGEPYEIEYRLRYRTGEYRWVLGKAQPVRDEDGTIVRWYGTCTDIDDQIKARQMLAQSREKLEEAVRERTDELRVVLEERDRAWNMAVDLLAVVNQDTTFAALNPAWTTLLGYEEKDLLGVSFTDLTHPDDLSDTLEVFSSVFETPLVTPYEYRVRHKDGSYRTTAWTASFNNGTVYATGRDVTEQHRQADALTATETALRQSQKLETIGQLTGGVAHDFNNLLMAIRSSLDLLERRLPQGDARLAALVENAVKATERGASLTQRMLAFACKQELDPKPVDVAQLLRGMRDLIEKSIGPQIAVTLEASCESNAMADPNQLELAVLNLAVNARDAMDGSGELVISLDCVAEKQASDLAAGEYIRIRIQDNGAGMNAQTLAQAAEPFFTTKGIGKGTGLGLSMVHGLASQSGGTFRLSSTVGVGTTAAIYLPVAADAQGLDSQIRPGVAPVVRRETLRILAVDDDALVLFGTLALLEDLGHTVFEAGSGAEALDVLDAEPDIDLVVTDQAMPNMTGVELARTIHERWPDLPVILASGYAEIPEGAGCHIAARLEKPFGEDLLRAALQKALARARETAE